MEEDYFEEIFIENKRLELIKDKFNNNNMLNSNEIEDLFRLYQIENNSIILNDARFEYSRFRYLYLIYSIDLDFKSIYYKINPNKKITDYIDYYNTLKEINKNEYQIDLHNKIESSLIQVQLLIPISQAEIESDKQYLDKIAKDWARVCLNERHSDERLKIISIETRELFKKKNIEAFLNNNLSKEISKDINRGLLKSYYVHNESIKIMDSIKSKNEPTFFNLNGVNFEINYYSFIHIINRHFAELISSQSLIISKSFHNTKINPYQIHLFVNNLVSLIKFKGIENSVFLGKRKTIIIKFYDFDYALCFDEYKHNKSKIILTTFFIIDPKNSKSKALIDRIVSLQNIKLDEFLSIYI